MTSLVAIVGSANHKGISIPIAARVAIPLPDIVVKLGAAIDRNNPNIVDHLYMYRDEILVLNDVV